MILKMGRRIMLVHHAGEQMTPISEVTDPEEVATMMARIEAGSRTKARDGFNSMLENFRKPAAASTPKNSTPAKRVAASHRSTTADDRVIDLTRTKRSGFARLLSSGKAGH